VITYSLVVNVWNVAASGVTVTDILPEHLLFVGFGAVPLGGTSDWNSGTRTMEWVFGNLGVGAVTVTYQARVDSYVQENTVLRNNAQVVCAGNPTPKRASVDVNMAKIYTVKVAVYNEVGEMVEQIWVQELSQPILDVDLSQTSITSIHGQVYVDYKGVQIAAWDGTGQGGDLVTNGNYYVKVDNVDPYGVVSSVAKEVTVSRSLARAEVKIYNEAGEVVKHLYEYVNDPTGSPMNAVNLSTGILKPTSDMTPTPGGTNVVMITTANGVTLVWDGRGDNGEVVTNGRYEIALNYADGKGGEETITQGITVERGNNEAEGEIYASPNVLKGGVKQTMVRVKSVMSLTVEMKVYDVGGELVKTVKGQAGANEAELDMTGLASGVYFAMVDLTDTNGRGIQKKTMQIVLQK